MNFVKLLRYPGLCLVLAIQRQIRQSFGQQGIVL